MTQSIEIAGLKIDRELYALVRDEIAPGTGVDPESFWTALGKIVRDLEPKNRRLLDKRDALQRQIDAWCIAKKGQPMSVTEYKNFLLQSGYHSFRTAAGCAS